MLKKKPLISAWVGRGNFGDELLSYGLRLELCKSFEVERFSYYEKGYESVYASVNEPQVISINTEGMSRFGRLYRRYFQSYKDYDLLFFGGGSILHSSYSVDWKSELLYKFRNSGRPSNSLAAAVGISVGPFADKRAEYKVSKFLHALDIIHCRDIASIDFVRKLDCKGVVIEGRDLAFSARALRPDLFASETRAGYVGCSFILDPKLSVAQQSEQFSKMRAIIDCVSGLGYKILLISLYTGDKYSDNLLHRRLRDASKNPDMVELFDYNGDVPATIAHIASCEFYVSMRLHGAITAYLSSVPFFALSIHPKMVEFCSEVFGESANCNIGDLSMGMDKLLYLLQSSIRSSSFQPAYDAGKDNKYALSSSELLCALEGGMHD